jgi:hypothetical protein
MSEPSVIYSIQDTEAFNKPTVGYIKLPSYMSVTPSTPTIKRKLYCESVYIDLTQDTKIDIDNTQEKKIKKEEEDELEDKIIQQAITLPIGTKHDNLKSENSSTNDKICWKL